MKWFKTDFSLYFLTFSALSHPSTQISETSPKEKEKKDIRNRSTARMLENI